MATAVAASGPIIVITEGSTDARWLRHALRLAAPDTEHLFEFLAVVGHEVLDMGTGLR